MVAEVSGSTESIQYTTKNFNYKYWGNYYTVNIEGVLENCGNCLRFAGYIGGSQIASQDILTFNTTSNSGQLHNVLRDSALKEEVSIGSTTTLHYGYKVKIEDIDIQSNTAKLVLYQDGIQIDARFIKEQDTYLFKKKVGNVNNLPIIALHVSNISNNVVTIDGFFQISDSFEVISDGAIVTPTPITPTTTVTPEEKFRLGPTVTLRPVTEVIDANQDGIVELFMINPSLNDVTLNVDVRINVPSGMHVYGESFGQETAGVVAGTFSVPPGTARTIVVVIKADKSARIGSHSLMFAGIYWPGKNKDNFQPLSLTYSVNVKESSGEPDNPQGTPIPTYIITPTVSPSIFATSNFEQEVKELRERLNKTEEKQSQQESRISWLESAINSIIDRFKSIFSI